MSNDDVEEGVVVKMLWGSSLKLLNAENLRFERANGVSPVNCKLLVQRGTINDTLVP